MAPDTPRSDGQAPPPPCSSIPPPAPVVHPAPRPLHHLVAPGEPGLGEAVAEADDGAMPHFHKVQLDAGLEGMESLAGCGWHGFTPQLSTRHRSPGVGAHPPPPVHHPRATPARFRSWGG